VEDQIVFNDSCNYRVSAILTAPDGGADRIAVMCHGFLSGKNSSTNKALTRMLTERGIATFRFDFFGHGDSDGPFEAITTTLAIQQTEAALDLVTARGYGRIGLVGSSFGGLVAILTAARRSDIACLALKCPVVDFAEELRLTLGPDELSRWQTTGTIPNVMGGQDRVRLQYDFYEDSLRQIAYGPAEHITVPTLIVQGEQDECVPLHQSRCLHEALRGPKKLILLVDADHQFTRAEDFHHMTTAISDWLVTHLPTKP
jgi:pimeloyl-ACP methyl ester carboxylesterase